MLYRYPHAAGSKNPLAVYRIHKDRIFEAGKTLLMRVGFVGFQKTCGRRLEQCRKRSPIAALSVPIAPRFWQPGMTMMTPRKKTARLYSEKFGLDVEPEDINCDGCKSEGDNRLEYCRSCAIRRCCREKGLENCVFCVDQPCEALNQFHVFHPRQRYV